jgi:hypothetical protein
VPASHLLPYQNYLAYYTNIANGINAATLHKMGCRLRPSDTASNRATGGALERMAREVAQRLGPLERYSVCGVYSGGLPQEGVAVHQHLGSVRDGRDGSTHRQEQ